MRRTTCIAAAGGIWLAAPVPAVATPDLPAPLSQQSEDEAALAGFRAAITEIRATLLAPGERVEGWDVGGVDPDAEVRALGAETHYILNRSEAGAGVTILTDRPIADFAPAHWQVVDSYGASSEPLDNPQIDFMPFSDRYVVASRVHTWARNDAGCWRNLSHALLYEIPDAPMREDDELAPMIFRMMVLAMEDQTICVRADGDRERGYRTRFFLPDGRELPALSSPSDVLTIVPAAPVDRLIAPAPAGSSN